MRKSGVVVSLTLSALINGIRISGGAGSGKSILGGWIGYEHYRHGRPNVILDPHGGTIDFFLANVYKASQDPALSPVEKEILWQKIIYVDMSGKQGQVPAFPLYYRYGQESLHEVAGRLVNTYARLDPALMTASIEGFNALKSMLIPAGEIIAALGWQVTEVIDLLTSQNKGLWRERFEEAVRRHPEVKPAVDFFRQQYWQWKQDIQYRRTSSLLIKLNEFRYNPVMRAIYASSRPRLDWSDVIATGKTVLLDFRGVTNSEERRFGLLWCLFNSFVEFIKYRGKGHHLTNVGLTIDELSEFGQLLSEDQSSYFSQDFNNLVNVIKRQYRVMLTIIHQEAYQLDPLTRKTLLSLGIQILGVSHDQESALEMARQFFPYQPYVKRMEPVFAASQDGPMVVHERPIELTLEEQRALLAQAFMRLSKFRFLTKLSNSEGDTAGRFVPMTIEPLAGQWVPEQTLTKIRSLLTQRDGLSIQEVLDEIDQRQLSRTRTQVTKAETDSDTLEEPSNDTTEGLTDHDFFTEE